MYRTGVYNLHYRVDISPQYFYYTICNSQISLTEIDLSLICINKLA